jgi:hypothetical protein
MNPWIKSLVGVLSLIIVGIAVALALAVSGGGGEAKAPISRDTADKRERHRQQGGQGLVSEKERIERALLKERRATAAEKARNGEASITGGGEQKEASPSKSHKNPGQSLEDSFAELESEISGAVGVAYSLAPGEISELGSLQIGHAWSSFKVPIVVTLMKEQNDSLRGEQEGLAASAITASDNDAAAALFSDLESKTGGDAAAAIEHVLATSGGATEVATAPPPPGAVSSWGQTQWSLASSTRFYGALACNAYGSREASLAINDMESVIPEQQWGFGQAEFPPGTQVAFKAGWGPDGSESGPYLVRQAGVIRAPGGQLVATIAAQDSSGSFESGVADLNRIADWVATNVSPTGSC